MLAYDFSIHGIYYFDIVYIWIWYFMYICIILSSPLPGIANKGPQMWDVGSGYHWEAQANPKQAQVEGLWQSPQES